MSPRRTSIFPSQDAGGGGAGSSRAWLLHARYVRGEHAACSALAADLLRRTGDAHRYAYFVQGLVLADAGRLQEALDKFHRCARLQPRDPEPIKQVAKCLFKQSRYQLALEAYKEAEKIAPKPDPDVYCCLAECAARLGDTARGAGWARQAVGAGGGERAAALLARLLVRRGDTEAALAALDTALVSGSGACSAETLAAAGALRLRCGDPRRAFQLLGAALAQDPAHHAAALALAAMMLRHGDADAALARLRAALAARPACVAACTDLGLALLAKRKFVAAVTCLQRAATAAPLCARAALALGLALLAARRPASAFCRLAAASALDPTNAMAVMLVGVSLERLQDERADAAYARAASLAPSDALVRYNMAARHARAARLPFAAADAAATSAALSADQAAHDMLTGPLGALIAFLRQSGMEVLQAPEEEGATLEEKDGAKLDREAVTMAAREGEIVESQPLSTDIAHDEV